MSTSPPPSSPVRSASPNAPGGEATRRAPRLDLARSAALAALAGAVFFGTTALPGCSSSKERDVQAYCESLCNKFASCGIVLGTAEACIAQCTMNANSGNSTCEPSSSEVDACVSAIESAECSALMTGDQPAACENLCPEETTDAGTSAMDAGAGGADGGSTAAGCAGLALCCPQVQDANSRMGCENTVTGANDAICTQTLSGFRAAGFCS